MTEATKVLVGCKLPNGIILEHPADDKKTVELRGLNNIAIVGAEHATTEVRGDFWDAWINSNAEFAPLKSGAIFVAKDERSLAAIAKENKKRKTGLEPMQTDGKDPRAAGTKAADAE